jgi:hypothetical protein
LLTSLELWVRFLAYTAICWWHRRSPLAIEPSDTMARELFSNHVRANGRLETGAFLASASNGYGISLSRWTKAPRRLFIALGTSKQRGTFAFVGFALFAASDLAKVVAATPPLSVHASRTTPNPFHADINVGAGREKSYYLLVAKQIRDMVKPQTELLR